MQTIQIETDKVLEAKLDKILHMLEGLSGIQAPATQPEPQPAQTTQPKPETPAAPAEEPQEPGKTYSQADLRQLVVKLSAAGKKAQVREIITAYAAKVSDLPEDKYNEVGAKLAALEV